MINKIKQIFSIYSFIKLMGFKWILFRFKYEYLKRTHYFDNRNNVILNKVNQLILEKKDIKPFNIINKDYKSNSNTDKAEKALSGKIFAFSSEYFDYSNENKEINWHKNPFIKKVAPSNMSWNSLPDFGVYGDIKCIWEASRFPQVFYFIDAYSITKKEKYAYACIIQILDWIKKNPYPHGVNYKCGQEIAFRLFAWIIACDYFSTFISKDNWLIIRKAIYVSLCRIDINIDYAAKSVRNNHSISEAVGLLVGGLLFPEFPESKHFKIKGLEYLCNEIAYQIYDDGTYIQHSFNYQRLAMDVLSFAILIMKNKNIEIPNSILEGHKKLYICLYSFIQKNGHLPNYGSNDGAYLFPIGNVEYRDYRESLNFASIVNEKKALFSRHHQLSNLFNVTATKNLNLPKKQTSFHEGGYYILKNDRFFIFIRCPFYHDRPAQNDALHMDVWIDGENIFSDAGSYSYNTDKHIKHRFTGMTGHNTILINDQDPMPSVLNFGYTNWIKGHIISHSDHEIICEHDGYRKYFGVTHRRQIKLTKDTIMIKDTLLNQKKPLNIKQIWNTTFPTEFNENEVIINKNISIASMVSPKKEPFLYSSYYNTYSKHDKIYFLLDSMSNTDINTTIKVIK